MCACSPGSPVVQCSNPVQYSIPIVQCSTPVHWIKTPQKLEGSPFYLWKNDNSCSVPFLVFQHHLHRVADRHVVSTKNKKKKDAIHPEIIIMLLGFDASSSWSVCCENKAVKWNAGKASLATQTVGANISLFVCQKFRVVMPGSYPSLVYTTKQDNYGDGLLYISQNTQEMQSCVLSSCYWTTASFAPTFL